MKVNTLKVVPYQIIHFHSLLFYDKILRGLQQLSSIIINSLTGFTDDLNTNLPNDYC